MKRGCIIALLVPVAALAGLYALFYFMFYAAPSRDPAVLQAIHAESVALMAKRPAAFHDEIPESEMPPAIARLGPEMVWIDPQGVTIAMKTNPDGGYSYFIPRTPADAPKLWAAITDLGYGVYWIARG